MNYLFYGVFEFDGKNFRVTFPDLKDIRTTAPTIQEALEQAEEVLEGTLVLYENIGKSIPTPSDIKKIKEWVVKNSQEVTKAEVFPVRVNSKIARAKNVVKYDKKSVTIEHYLNVLAQEHHINVSKVLNEALKEKFCVN